MPKKLQIQAADRRRILKKYAAGETPSEIASSCKELKLSSAQIANLISRSGLQRAKGAIQAAREKTVKEVVESVRQQGVAELEQILTSLKEGAVVDSDKLKNAWHLVSDAAGASSLMRSKTLLLNQTMKLFGAEKESEPSSMNLLAVVYANPIGEAEEPVKTVEQVAADIQADEVEDGTTDAETLDLADEKEPQ